MSVQSSQWSRLQRARNLKMPPEESLYALCRDALCGESTPLNGLSVSTSASEFIDHLLTSFALFSGVGMGSKEATSSGDGQDVLPSWPGAHTLTSPLGVLSLHMMKLNSPSAVSRLWRVFVRTLAVDFCENLTSFGTYFDTEDHIRFSGWSGFWNAIHTTPHALWMQGINDCVGDMINANDFMEWALAESDWEAAELGIPHHDEMDELATIEEEGVSDVGEDGLTGKGAGPNGDIADMITRMLNMLPTSTSRANVIASGMATPRRSTGEDLPEGAADHPGNSTCQDPERTVQPRGHDPRDTHVSQPCQHGWEVCPRAC